SWFLAALRKKQVFSSLQFFMGGQCRKVVEVINDLRSENQSTPTQQSIDTESEERVTRTVL
ncbi:14748_t:CDS:2, partial [Rhizophagus irregularis]